jgi:hypothetical protein
MKPLIRQGVSIASHNGHITPRLLRFSNKTQPRPVNASVQRSSHVKLAVIAPPRTQSSQKFKKETVNARSNHIVGWVSPDKRHMIARKDSSRQEKNEWKFQLRKPAPVNRLVKKAEKLQVSFALREEKRQKESLSAKQQRSKSSCHFDSFLSQRGPRLAYRSLVRRPRVVILWP